MPYLWLILYAVSIKINTLKAINKIIIKAISALFMMLRLVLPPPT